MSASAFPWSRVYWYRAAMMAIAETETRKEEGPVSETGGTANLTTRVYPCLSVFIRVHPWPKLRGRMRCSGSAPHDCTQDRVLWRRRRAARRVSRGGEHAVAGGAVAGARGASCGDRGIHLDCRRRERAGREAAHAHGAGADSRSQSPQSFRVR